MIGLIEGEVVSRDDGRLLVRTAGGVGYLLSTTLDELGRATVGKTVRFFTYLKVSENALDLYAFENVDDLNFFKLLLTVSGVGPKTALSVINLGAPNEIRAAIARGDVKYLTAVQGMGKKTAERVVVELKSKFAGYEFSTAGATGHLSEAISALVSLGYDEKEARQALVELAPRESEDLATVIKAALARLKI